jgi:hypothetical protein
MGSNFRRARSQKQLKATSVICYVVRLLFSPRMLLGASISRDWSHEAGGSNLHVDWRV